MPTVPRREHVTVDGLSSEISTAGPAEAETAVVFLHGNPGTGRYWDQLVAQVGDFARCVAPDLPGYGSASDAPGFDFSPDGYSRYVASLLDTLGIKHAHLVGHDLGCVAAIGWGALEPSRLASLVLMNAGAMPGYRWHRYARLYRVPVVGELLMMGANPRSVRGVLRSGSQHSPPDEFVREVLAQYHVPATRRAVLAYYRSVPDLGAVTVKAAESLARPDLPVLVIWGAGDPYVPARFAERQRDYFPKADVLVLPGSGHWPLQDDFDAVAAAVVSFLRRNVDRVEEAATRPSAPTAS